MPSPPSFNPEFYANFNALLSKQVEGKYQRDTAEAYRTREEGGQVAPNAASLRGLQGAEAYYRKQLGLTAESGRYLTPEGADMLHRQTDPGYYQRGQGAQPGVGAVQPDMFLPTPLGQQTQQPQQPFQQYQTDPSTQQPYMPPKIPVPGEEPIYHGAPAVPYGGAPAAQPYGSTQRTQGQGLSVGQQIARNPVQTPSLLRPTTPLTRLNRFNALTTPPDLGSTSEQPYRKGTSNVVPLRKGSASVKGKGGNGKSAKSGGPPKGLEAILPALMATSQGGQMGPQAAGGLPPPMAPGAAAAPGFARGMPNVMHYQGGTDNVTERFGSFMPVPQPPPSAPMPSTGQPPVPLPTSAPGQPPVQPPPLDQPIGQPLHVPGTTLDRFGGGRLLDIPNYYHTQLPPGTKEQGQDVGGWFKWHTSDGTPIISPENPNSRFTTSDPPPGAPLTKLSDLGGGHIQFQTPDGRYYTTQDRQGVGRGTPFGQPIQPGGTAPSPVDMSGGGGGGLGGGGTTHIGGGLGGGDTHIYMPGAPGPVSAANTPLPQLGPQPGRAGGPSGGGGEGPQSFLGGGGMTPFHAGLHAASLRPDSGVIEDAKGDANVKAPAKKGNGKGKKPSNDLPKGLAALLPMLMAAAQGGGAGPGGPPQAPPQAPGGPGFARGVSRVRGYDEGTSDTPHPMGMQASPSSEGRLATQEPSQNIEDRRGQTYTPPSLGAQHLQNMANDVATIGSAIGIALHGHPTAAPGSLGDQAGLNDIPTGSRFSPLLNVFRRPGGSPGMARGAASVQPAPNYPFGAGYLFGATAVPGQGSGTVDTVPAMLAPHEAVLNRAAADMLGRGLISMLNKAGTQRMGMR